MSTAKDVLVDLLSSRKFIMAILGVVAGAVAHFGFQMDPNAVFVWLSPLIAAIVGQGIADHGKEAAKIRAAAMTNAAATEIDTAKIRQGGFIARPLLAALAVIGIACAAVKADVKTMSGKFAACTKADLGQAVVSQSAAGALLDVVAAIITANPTTLESELSGLAATAGVDAVHCAIAAVESVLSPPTGAAPLPGLLRAKAWLATEVKP